VHAIHDLFSARDSIRKAEAMNRLSRGLVALAALVATVESVEGATAGHMLKSTTPAASTDQDVTGSIRKPDATADAAKAVTKKHSAKTSGTRSSDVTGSIKPTSNSGQ